MSIQEAQNELRTEASIQKEFFEVMHTFLFEQWSSIASLEEEVVINDCEETPLYTAGSCREVFVLLNACIKAMSSKISTTVVASSSVNFRDSKLPDFKVNPLQGEFVDHS